MEMERRTLFFLAVSFFWMGGCQDTETRRIDQCGTRPGTDGGAKNDVDPSGLDFDCYNLTTDSLSMSIVENSIAGYDVAFDKEGHMITYDWDSKYLMRMKRGEKPTAWIHFGDAKHLEMFPNGDLAVAPYWASGVYLGVRPNGEVYELWKTDAGGLLTACLAAHPNGWLYATDMDGHWLLSIDTATGKGSWHYVSNLPGFSRGKKIFVVGGGEKMGMGENGA